MSKPININSVSMLIDDELKNNAKDNSFTIKYELFRADMAVLEMTPLQVLQIERRRYAHVIYIERFAVWNKQGYVKYQLWHSEVRGAFVQRVVVSNLKLSAIYAY